MSGLINKVKGKVAGFKDQESGKTGAGGVMAEGKERYADYNKDKADGKVDWGQQAKDASKDWRGGAGGGAAAPPK